MDLITDHEVSDNRRDLGTTATRSDSGIPDSRTDFEIQDSEATDDYLDHDLKHEIHRDHTEAHNSCRTVDTVLLSGGPQATTRRFKRFVSEWYLSFSQPVINTVWQYYEESVVPRGHARATDLERFHSLNRAIGLYRLRRS